MNELQLLSIKQIILEALKEYLKSFESEEVIPLEPIVDKAADKIKEVVNG